jgi:hypothetical protein
LKKDDKEYIMVEKEFLNRTSGNLAPMRDYNTTITRIVKVINPIRAKFYELKKETFENKSEVMAFHGNRHGTLESLFAEGFDGRVGSACLLCIATNMLVLLQVMVSTQWHLLNV